MDRFFKGQEYLPLREENKRSACNWIRILELREGPRQITEKDQFRFHNHLRRVRNLLIL